MLPSTNHGTTPTRNAGIGRKGASRSRNSTRPHASPPSSNVRRTVCARLMTTASPSQVPEYPHDLLIDLALEGHNQAGQPGHGPPRPVVEFFCMAVGRRVDADLALVALEAEGEPF